MKDEDQERITEWHLKRTPMKKWNLERTYLDIENGVLRRELQTEGVEPHTITEFLLNLKAILRHIPSFVAFDRLFSSIIDIEDEKLGCVARVLTRLLPKRNRGRPEDQVFRKIEKIKSEAKRITYLEILNQNPEIYKEWKQCAHDWSDLPTDKKKAEAFALKQAFNGYVGRKRRRHKKLRDTAGSAIPPTEGVR